MIIGSVDKTAETQEYFYLTRQGVRYIIKAVRRHIEVVITSRTRNAVVRKGTWVRIPLSPLGKWGVSLFTHVKRCSFCITG